MPSHRTGYDRHQIPTPATQIHREKVKRLRKKENRKEKRIKKADSYAIRSQLEIFIFRVQSDIAKSDGIKNLI